MVALAVPRFAMLLAAACGIVGCASGPELPRAVTVTEGQRTVVALEQVGNKLLLTLQNDSAARPAEVYSGAPDGRKVVADAQLQALLDVFTANGMFEKSLGAVPPDARDVLTVVQGERRWIWARRQAGMQATEQAFHEARAYFLQLYNSAVAYHGRAGDERPNFKDENTRAASEAEAAKQKLESARRKP